MRVSLGLLGVFALSACASHSANESANSSCASVSDDARRLACYDDATRAGKTAGQPAAVQPPTGGDAGENVPRPGTPADVAKFGDNAKLHHEQKVDMPETISAAVTKVAAIPGGLYLVTLDNGQVWQTTQADWSVEFNSNDWVTIKRMPLGGYMIEPEGGTRTVSIKRIQ
jgi:hypothetical protein